MSYTVETIFNIFTSGKGLLLLLIYGVPFAYLGVYLIQKMKNMNNAKLIAVSFAVGVVNFVVFLLLPRVESGGFGSMSDRVAQALPFALLIFDTVAVFVVCAFILDVRRVNAMK